MEKEERKVNIFLKKWLFLIYFPITIIYLEIILKLFTDTVITGVGLIFTVLFSIFFGIILTLLSNFFKSEKANRITALIISFLVFLIYGTQLVYHTIMGKFLIFYSITSGGEQVAATDSFVLIALNNILACAFPLIVLLIPFLILLIFGKKILPFNKTTNLTKLFTFLGAIAFRALIILLIAVIPFTKDIYFGVFSPTQSVEAFGMATTEFLDIKNNLFKIGGEGVLTVTSDITSSNEESDKEPEEYGYNVLDIDFASLIANEKDETIKEMHEYFSKQEPTRKNEWTGKFKDYNLIMFTAEGFAPYAIDKELTPTLYKMQQNGFKFTNYYNPPWCVSTSDGEYVECTGLIPKSGVWSFYETGKNNVFLPFTMAQQFLNIGVNPVYGYHNNTYTYYHRDISHPNLGYLYKGQGNGLKITKTWPQSDKEMIENTALEYISKDQRFHAYYMTVSGHMAYDFKNNYISAKYKDYVKDLPYSEKVKAYIACNMDLDRALESLLKMLEEAGVANKTLIAISPDHTPYGLEGTGSKKYDTFNEIFGHEVETTFEVNESVFLLYSPSMEKSITIDKPCSPLDIIPTLNNLLGFEYDSRLLPGKDIFSNSDGLVIFENRSFISEKGKYNSSKNTFTLNDGEVLDDQKAYLTKMKKTVANKFVFSKKIIETNYYSKVLKDRTHIKGGLTK